MLLFLTVFMVSCTKKEGGTQVQPAEMYVQKTVVYKQAPPTPPTLLSLDVWSFASTGTSRPVVIYIHGGGWKTGDKKNQLQHKLALFQSLGYVFISINYRLSPNPSQLNNPNRIKYPVHNQDVADAVKWVVDSISRYGGNPARMVLMGHSAGAHLASLTGISPLFLPARNIPLMYLRGVASIDTEGYDVGSQIQEEIYQNAFGTDPAVHLEASPLHQIRNNTVYPRFFVAKRGNTARLEQANAFIARLQSAGATVEQVNGSMYDHEGINDAIGHPDDVVVTPALKSFLSACFR